MTVLEAIVDSSHRKSLDNLKTIFL